jgi:hypothetical protein
MSFFLSSPVGCYFLKKDDHPVIKEFPYAGAERRACELKRYVAQAWL